MSSEALERAKQNVREALEQGVLSHQCGVDSIAAFGTLLAEVARLEQERDEALSVREGLISPVQKVLQLRDALAVAREREQRLREAAEIVVAEWQSEQSARFGVSIGVLRAALVDEPAAATLAEPEEDKIRGTKGARTSLAADSGSASAAADEPGETPA